MLTQVSQILGKPGILREFSEPGKLSEFSRNSVQPQAEIVTNKLVSPNAVFGMQK